MAEQATGLVGTCDPEVTEAGATLTSVGAFTTLLLVPDPGLQSFGAIVVIALLMAFGISVIVLPSALGLWSRAGHWGITGESGQAPESARRQNAGVSQD